MKINELGPKQQYPEIQKPTEQAKGAQKPQAGKQKSVDKVEVAGIARQSKETGRLFRLAKAKMQAIADVRYDKIQAAKRKIENGEYNRPEVISALADKLAKNPEIQASLPKSAEKAASAGLSPQRMEVIKNRLQSGFYDKPEVVEKIANSILTDLGSQNENNS